MQPARNGTWLSRESGKMTNGSTGPFCLTPDEKLAIMEALDHIHVTKQYQEMGSCTVCKKISVKKCSGCGAFYCSSECQTFDWPKHRVTCSKQRDSASDRSSFASSRRMRGACSIKNISEDAIIISDGNSPFTALTNQLKKNSGSLFTGSKNLSNFKIANRQYQNREPKGNEVLVNGVKDFKKSVTKKNIGPRKSFNNKKSSPEESKDKTSNINNIDSSKNLSERSSSKLLKAVENIASDGSNFCPRKQSALTKIGKTEVVGTFRELPSRYWVMNVADVKKYDKIQSVLNEECVNYESLSPKVGLVCACTFDDEWFRAKITSLDPLILVHFIDFGNITNYEGDLVKKLPDNLQNMPGLVYLIEFEDGTPEEYKTNDLENSTFVIEETSKASDGVPRVKILEGPFGATKKPHMRKRFEKKASDNLKLKKEKSVMDSVTATTGGMLFFMPGVGRIRFASIIPDSNKEAGDCLEKVIKIETSNTTLTDAKEGDLVVATDKEGNDQRGRIISRLGSIYYVQLIDCGDVISTDSVYALPCDLKDLVQLGVKIIVEEIYSEELMMKAESCFFTINGQANSGKWPCILKSTDQQLIAKALLEKPTASVEWKPKYVYLKSGSIVEICSVSSPNSFYVRSMDGETEQKFLDMNMEMIQLAPKAISFASLPLPGEICCARSENDGCYYRAIVNSIENGKVKVFFVDFGNEQKADIRDIKPLPDTLKNIPFFAVKVKLKNVSAKPWNNMIKDYIAKLTSENVELTMTYKESIGKGVILQETVSGTVVNEFIEKARDKDKDSNSKSRSSALEKSEIFLDDDLKYTTVPSGTECGLALLHINETEFESSYTFWATVAGVENFNYINGELSLLISEYCENVSKPYKPIFRELCLAEYEGFWYRAICVGNEGDLYKIFFVDFGNFCEMESSCIRKMNKDFIKAPALAMNCTLNEREKLRGNPELTKKICGVLYKKLNTLISGVTVTKVEEGTFLLKIPEIDALLAG